jgi:hypothetical protein
MRSERPSNQDSWPAGKVNIESLTLIPLIPPYLKPDPDSPMLCFQLSRATQETRREDHV